MHLYHNNKMLRNDFQGDLHSARFWCEIWQGYLSCNVSAVISSRNTCIKCLYVDRKGPSGSRRSLWSSCHQTHQCMFCVITLLIHVTCMCCVCSSQQIAGDTCDCLHKLLWITDRLRWRHVTRTMASFESVLLNGARRRCSNRFFIVMIG